MRQLLPEARDDVDVAEVYDAERPAPPDRPWVLVNMVASIDGATAVEGRTAALGSPADRAAFDVIRSLADVILVGAGTAREEGYGPPRQPTGAAAERRAARGQAPRPRLAVVTRRVDLDPGLRFLDDDPPPYLVTVQDPPVEPLTALGGRVEEVRAGERDVDLGTALRRLRETGARTVLCEGGPSLNAALWAADLVDELCLTIAPVVVGGASSRLVAPWPDLGDMRAFRIGHLLTDEDQLLLRYLRVR